LTTVASLAHSSTSRASAHRFAEPAATLGGTSTSRTLGLPCAAARRSSAETPESGTCETSVVTAPHPRTASSNAAAASASTDAVAPGAMMMVRSPSGVRRMCDTLVECAGDTSTCSADTPASAMAARIAAPSASSPCSASSAASHPSDDAQPKWLRVTPPIVDSVSGCWMSAKKPFWPCTKSAL